MNKPSQAIEKAVGYLVRKSEKNFEILVFDHDEKYSDAGTQVVAGTVNFNENPEHAIIREYQEESGLRQLSIVSKIDEYVFFREVHGKYNRRHVYLLKSEVEVSNYWTHVVSGSGEDSKLNFHYFWMSIEDAKNSLSDRLGDSLIKLEKYLSDSDLEK